MTLKTNKFFTMYLWGLKKSRWISILFLSLLMLACPGLFLISNINGNTISTLEFSFKFLIIPIVVLFTFIISVENFRFMHKRGSIDLFNSLPLRRTTIFLSVYCSGLSLVLIPIIINFLLCLVLCDGNNVLLLSIIHNFAYIVLAVISSFTLSAFVAVCSGTTIDMIISVLVINLIYPCLICLILFLSSTILPGCNILNLRKNTLVTAIAPYASAFVPFINYKISESYSYPQRTDMLFIIWWIIFSVLLFVISFNMYKKRKNEKTQLSFEYSFPVIVIKCISILVFSVGAAIIFLKFVGYSHLSFWIGAIIGAIIGYLVLESIYSRGFKNIVLNIKYCFVMLCVLLLIYLLLVFGWLGYDTRIVKESEINSVEISGNALNEIMKHYSSVEDAYIIDNEKVSLDINLKDERSIQEVYNLHQRILSHLKNKRGYPYNPIDATKNKDITIKYNLKDGSEFIRSYSINDYDESTRNYAGQIADLEEYKIKSRLAFNINEKDISEIEIISVVNNNKTYKEDKTLSLDISKKEELLNALKKDLLNDTLQKQKEWYTSSKDNYKEIIIYSHSDYYDNPDMKRTLFAPSHYVIPSYYENTLKTLTYFDLV